MVEEKYQPFLIHVSVLISRQLSDIICQMGQLSDGTTVSLDNCQTVKVNEILHQMYHREEGLVNDKY